MHLDSYMPVRIISGKNCLLEKSALLRDFGKRCIILTGKSSALKSGALEDVKKVLTENDIDYFVFNEIEPNPLTSTCKKAGDAARDFCADFVFGVGGGSVLDAAKAVAIFAKNQAFTHTEIYKRTVPCEHLPVILLGTTSGTGSEVTGVSVLTNSDTGLKKSISGADCYADVSFCDYKYTLSVDVDTRISTALDAFCHAVESFVASSSNDLSEAYALKAIGLLKNYILTDKLSAVSDAADFEKLYIASLYAGLAINITGTCFPHTVGYYLTESYNVSHGKACAVFMPVLLDKTKKYCPEKLQAILECMNTDLSVLCKAVSKIAFVEVNASADEISNVSLRWKDGVKNFDRTPGGFTFAEAKKALLELIS